MKPPPEPASVGFRSNDRRGSIAMGWLAAALLALITVLLAAQILRLRTRSLDEASNLALQTIDRRSLEQALAIEKLLNARLAADTGAIERLRPCPLRPIATPGDVATPPPFLVLYDPQTHAGLLIRLSTRADFAPASSRFSLSAIGTAADGSAPPTWPAFSDVTMPASFTRGVFQLNPPANGQVDQFELIAHAHETTSTDRVWCGELVR